MIAKGCLETLMKLASNTNDIDTLKSVARGIADIAFADSMWILILESNSFQMLQT